MGRFYLSSLTKLQENGELLLDFAIKFNEIITRKVYDIRKYVSNDTLIYEFWLKDSRGIAGMAEPIQVIEVNSIGMSINNLDSGLCWMNPFVYYVAYDLNFIVWEKKYDTLFKMSDHAREREHKDKNVKVVEIKDKFGNKVKILEKEFHYCSKKLAYKNRIRNLKPFQKNKSLMHSVINKKFPKTAMHRRQLKKSFLDSDLIWNEGLLTLYNKKGRIYDDN